MDIPKVQQEVFADQSGGRCLPVEAVRIDLGQSTRDGLLENFNVPFPDLLPLLRGKLILPAPLHPSLVHLIITVPERDGGVVPQSLHIIYDFVPDVVIVILAARVHRAGEHEIVPDQQSGLIAQIVEHVVLELASAPDSYHVIVAIDGILDRLIVHLWVLQGSGHEHIRRNVVASLHKHIFAIEIDHECGAIASLILLLDHLDSSDTGSVDLRVH